MGEDFLVAAYGALCGIGGFALLFTFWALTLDGWARRREQRRLDHLAHELARYPSCAVSNLSPLDIIEARERWPVDAAFATILARGEAELRLREAEAMADAAFDGYRAEAEGARAPDAYDVQRGIRETYAGLLEAPGEAK